MKFPVSWLKDYLATNASLSGIVDTMTQAGLEVEHVSDPATGLAAFTTARIVEASAHPDADRLRVCTVDTVDGRKQIVCGAPNARAGLVGIYAPPGTRIPGSGIVLDKKPRRIRGIESHGMLCSEKELDAGDAHDHIIALDDTVEPGIPAATALGLDDPVITFGVTPNRGDWLGVKGIARDLAAAGVGGFIDEAVHKPQGAFDCPVTITLDVPQSCPFFVGAVIKGVENGNSPEWMQARLRAGGVTPKNLLVDVTNYVALDCARPLHAYDATKLGQSVHVRSGIDGEQLETLDGKTCCISPDMCIIADEHGPVGIGGVMGGVRAAVSPETRDVFLESAWFDPAATARTGRTTGIVSDARHRFERGVDPQSCLDGLYLAIGFILEYGGGTASHVKIAGTLPMRTDRVRFHKRDIARLTGMSVQSTAMKKTLKRLGMEIEDTGETWFLKVPGWRFDIHDSADIVEEIARLEGFDKLPVQPLPPPQKPVRTVTGVNAARLRVARRVLAARGFLEAITWSFMSKQDATLFGGGSDALTLANPAASGLDHMRPCILANLAKAAQKATNAGERDIRLFEVGPVYSGDSPKDQRTVVAGLVRPDLVRHWQGDGQSHDAHAARADLNAVLEALDQPPERFRVEAPRQPHWHPGQAGCLKLGPKITVAHFGALHPRVLRALEVDGPVYGFELVLGALPQMRVRTSKTRPVLRRARLTPVRRDFAFVVETGTRADTLVTAIRRVDKELIAMARVFDTYQGKGIKPGYQSVAVEVTLQPDGKTLTDSEIESISAEIVQAVTLKTGGTLRQ